MQVGEQQLGLLAEESRLDGQHGADLLGRALQDGPDQQVGQGHAEHTRLLLGRRLQGQGARVEAWRRRGGSQITADDSR